jgi:hypothetical protein
MFTTKDTKKFDDIMDSIKSFGEKIGSKIHIKGSWIIKAIIMSVAIITIGGSILVVTVIKGSFGKRN